MSKRKFPGMGKKTPIRPVRERLYRAPGPELGRHEWTWKPDQGLVCTWCGESESTALSAGCPVYSIRDRDGQVFIVRALEPEPDPDRLAEILDL